MIFLGAGVHSKADILDLHRVLDSMLEHLEGLQQGVLRSSPEWERWNAIVSSFADILLDGDTPFHEQYLMLMAKLEREKIL